MGELLHVDIKNLGRFWWPGKAMLAEERRTLNRGAGWQVLHRAACWYAEQGIAVEQVMTGRRRRLRQPPLSGGCRKLGIEHLCTPSSPRAPTARPSG